MGGRRSIWLITAATLVPLLLFVTFQIGFAAREQRRTLEAQAASTAERVMVAADGETMRITTILDALATASVLRDGGIGELERRFDEFRTIHPDLRGLSVGDAAGTELASFGLPQGSITRTIDGRGAARPLFVGFARSGDCLCLLFERPSKTATGASVVLVLQTDSRSFLRLMPPSDGQFTVAALLGPKARFIARSLNHQERFGQLGSTFVQSAIRSGKAGGLYRGTTLEGVENYSAFTRSASTGWSVHVALESAYIDKPARRFLTSLGMAALLSLLLAGLLIAFAIRQIREAKAFAERMQQTQKMEALGQLTGGLAHDFNNLLTPVIGTLDLLAKRESLDERGRKLARGALASAERAAKLTGQLLAFSRRQKLALVPVDVRPLADEVREMIERSLGSRNPFTVTLDPKVRCVMSDVTQLEVALLNLAHNARDSSPEAGPVTLDIRQELEDWVRFTIRDDGTGMDEETKRRALEPFFTTKETGKGTGLGLAQVFGLVEQSGGTIEIESAPGAGTSVVMRLPACAEEAMPVTERAREQEPERALKLLVVDDDPAVRAAIAGMLMDDGHHVEAVASGRAALAALAEAPVDLVLVDYLMPGMTGAELIAEVLKDGPGPRFLMVTGFADTDAVAAKAPGTPMLAKPFTPDRLRKAVREAISPTAG